jgi:hypothetical protein
MKISPSIACGTFLSMVLLCLPLGTSAVQTDQLCAGMADSLWDQWQKGMLPKNADTIIKVLKVASDCPRLAGSMDKIANDIKAYQEKKERAIKRLKKTVKAHETYYPHRPCPPAMDWAGGPAGGC